MRSSFLYHWQPKHREAKKPLKGHTAVHVGDCGLYQEGDFEAGAAGDVQKEDGEWLWGRVWNFSVPRKQL